MLTVNGKYLYKDGQRFFYLADTCWSAFTNLTLPDWKFYLDTRKAQGYTAIQINLLRQYDSSCPIKGREPFAIIEHDDGSYEYDFSKINTSYFDNVEKMLEQMQERGMVPSLVLLWGNFVPDTWMSHFVKNNTIPFEQIRPYIKYVVNRFKKFNPIWFVSGDVGFVDNETQKSEAAIKYYREVLESAKEVDPEGIYTFHINGESYELPDEFKKRISFFSYQSGHAQTGQNTAFTIPQKLRTSGYEGPIVDAEICYEGLQKMHSQYPERYSAFEVRKSAWRAVLAGADMGVGYGSFGLWPLKELDDGVFSTGAVGQGVAVSLEKGEVKAPFDGTVVSVFPTKHAITLKSKSGVELLIHIGLDTVELKGKGFKQLVHDGDAVRKGDLLETVDLDLIKEAGFNLASPVIVTNPANFDKVASQTQGHVQAGDQLLLATVDQAKTEKVSSVSLA